MLPRTTTTPIRLAVTFLIASVVALAGASTHAAAAAQPFGTVLVSGASWAGQYAQLGDLNVYSNGPTFGYSGQSGPYGELYQCTELATRWAAIRYGEPTWWNAGSAAGFWTAGPSMPIPFRQLPNGGPNPPQFGDILVFGPTTSFPSGHVAVVSGTEPGYVDIVEENGSWTGTDRLPISGTTMPPRAGSNQPVIGWLRSSTATPQPYTPTPGAPAGYVLDGYGGVHPFGSAPETTVTGTWPNWDIARGIASQPNNPSAGYVLDGFGGLHPFGGAPNVTITSYWPGWDIARAVVLRSDGTSGFVLDGFGSLHPFGVAGDIPAAPAITGYWRGWDIAHAVALRSNGTSGYVMDGFGGLHPFGGAPDVANEAYWGGWNVARAVTMLDDGGGYTADAYGGVHPFGDAPAVNITAYYPSGDLARGIIATDAGGGYVAFRTGVVEPFGDAPPVNQDYMSAPAGRGAS